MAIRITDPEPDTDTDPNRDTGKTCFGGGMHYPSASSAKHLPVGLTILSVVKTSLTITIIYYSSCSIITDTCADNAVKEIASLSSVGS